MLIYCESNDKNGRVVFEVDKLEDLKYWWRDMQFETKWDEQDRRSLIDIINLNYLPYKGPKKGFWYKIPFSFWNNCVVDIEEYSLEKDNTSLLFRVKVDAKGFLFDFKEIEKEYEK